jgi:hypothetical protein
VQAVLRLVKDFLRVLLKHVSGDLLTPVGGQAVLHHAAGVGESHQLLVHLIAHKGLLTDGLLLLLAHGGPHVGEHHVSAHSGLLGIAAEGKLKVGVALGKSQHIRMRIIALRAGHCHFHAGLQATHDQGVGHVVAVADVAHLQPFQHRLMLPDGHQVGQHLAGMAEVGQAVDDRDIGVGRQGLHFLLGKGTDHDTVAVAQQHPGGILYRLAPADLALLAGKKQGVAAQLVHTGLKGDTGTGGVLLKNHGQGLALELIVSNAMLLAKFQLVGGVQDLQDLLAGQVQQLQQVFFHRLFPSPAKISGSAWCRCPRRTAAPAEWREVQCRPGRWRT